MYTLYVALLAEGVDRNILYFLFFVQGRKSPSSRRAWIEILSASTMSKSGESPSSRRAWIEILKSRWDNR